MFAANKTENSAAMTKENFTKLVLVFTMVMYPLYELCSQNVTVKGRVSINAGDFTMSLSKQKKIL